MLVHHNSHPSKQLVLGDAHPWLPRVPLLTHPAVCTGLQLRGAAAPFSSNRPCYRFKHVSNQIQHQLSLPFAFSSPCFLRQVNTLAEVTHSDNSSLFSQSTREQGQKASDCPSATCRAGQEPRLLTSLPPEGISHGDLLAVPNTSHQAVLGSCDPLRAARYKVAFKIPFIRA